MPWKLVSLVDVVISIIIDSCSDQQTRISTWTPLKSVSNSLPSQSGLLFPKLQIISRQLLNLIRYLPNAIDNLLQEDLKYRVRASVLLTELPWLVKQVFILMRQLGSIVIVSWVRIPVGACQNLILVSLNHVDVVHYIWDIAVELLRDALESLREMRWQGKRTLL
jgi:hypothetical protein